MESKSKGTLIWSWALYDWANSAFATTVMAGFFPLFFKKYWSGDMSVVESTYQLGLVNSLSSFALALISPALGAIADQGAWRKKFLLLFTLIGVVGSVALGFINQGEWQLAIAAFACGLVGFTGVMPFYDALLVQVAPANRLDRVSALGYSMGYLGGGLLFSLNVAMYLSPQTFGIADGAAAIKFSFVSVGVWWLLFSLPLFLYVPEWPAREKAKWSAVVRHGFHSFVQQTRDLRRHKPLFYFLLGFLFYNDAVNTIIKMAVDYGMSVGIESSDLIKALLMVQFIGFPSAIAFGYLAEKTSPERGIWICLLVYLGVTVYASQLSTAGEFFALAATIGVVQGGIQALSRSYYARLVTPEQSAQYFGFFNMIGKFSSVLGPLLVGWVGLQVNNSRAGILVLSLFFLLGGWLFYKSGRCKGVQA